MKMVITIPGTVVHNSEHRQRFIDAVGRLVDDGHWITIVQGAEQSPGSSPQSQPQTGGINGNRRSGESVKSVFDNIANTGRLLAAHLATLNICGLAMVASDADICRVRKQADSNGRSSQVDICSVNARWLDIICGNKGVAIISNVALSAWRQSYVIDLSHLAASCAINWGADSLTFLTNEEGVMDSRGEVIRWLDVRDIAVIHANCRNHCMIDRLQRCKEALESGVHRVRMLPISRIPDLSVFYFSKLECGTEMIVGWTPQPVRQNLPELKPCYVRDYASLQKAARTVQSRS